MIAINKHSANPKVWSVEMPNTPYSNRYAQSLWRKNPLSFLANEGRNNDLK